MIFVLISIATVFILAVVNTSTCIFNAGNASSSLVFGVTNTEAVGRDRRGLREFLMLLWIPFVDVRLIISTDGFIGGCQAQIPWVGVFASNSLQKNLCATAPDR